MKSLQRVPGEKRRARWLRELVEIDLKQAQ
jgi:hypothetical protein